MQRSVGLAEPISRSQETTRAASLVSVCIVNWNCRELLRQCLRSLEGDNPGCAVEVIVVDNASTDGAADMVERDFPEVQLIRNEANEGFARGCNQAAKRARGKYLLFLNNDTWVPAGALGQLLRYAEQHPEAGLIAPRLRDGSGEIQLSARFLPTLPALLHRLSFLRPLGLFRRSYQHYRGRQIDLNQTTEVEAVMGAAILMPQSVFHQVGGWNEAYTFGGEDFDLCHRVGKQACIVYHPAVEIIHLGREASRQQVGFVHANTVIGITRSLRDRGTSAWGLLLYKILFTLDLPLQALVLSSKWLLGTLVGRKKHAKRAWLDLVGVQYFLRNSLWEFWRT
jgi:N-acetylglucosaminyl-diphospho-decaprenol L-rhamnosyltransferase